MIPKERIKICMIAEKIYKNKDFAKQIKVKDISHYTIPANKRNLGEEKT